LPFNTRLVFILNLLSVYIKYISLYFLKSKKELYRIAYYSYFI